MPAKPSSSARARGKPSTRKNAPTNRTQPRRQPTPVDSPADSEQALRQGPLRLAALWSQWAEQVQRAGQQTLQGLRQDAELEAEDVQHAGTPQQLAGLPIGFAAEQAARWAQLSTQVTASLLDAQAAWFRDIESVTTRLMGPWFTHNGRIEFGSAQDLVEPPEPNGPMQLLSSAQRMWSESAKAWLQAMSHDLQSDSPAAPR
jgi:hypothetical protein